jgi:hypothetical protein
MGCHETCVQPDGMGAVSDVECEHHTMTGGEWFKVNKAGRVVARLPADLRLWTQ